MFFGAARGSGFPAPRIRQLPRIRSEVVAATCLLPSVEPIGALNTAIREARVKVYRLEVASPDAGALAVNEKGLAASLGKLASLDKDYEALINSTEERALFDPYSGTWAAYAPCQTELLALMRAGRQPEALDLLTSRRLADFNNGAVDALQKSAVVNKSGARANADASVRDTASAKSVAWIAVTTPPASAGGFSVQLRGNPPAYAPKAVSRPEAKSPLIPPRFGVDSNVSWS